MVNFETRLNQLNFSRQLVELNQILEDTRAKVSVLGERIITKNGEDYVPLEGVARRVIEAADLRSLRDDLAPRERIAGVEIVRKLRRFYEETQHSNLFARVLTQLREISLWSNARSTYFILGELPEYKFLGYSEERFIQEFGNEWDRQRNEYVLSNGSFTPPYRIIALENKIREKI